MENRDPKQERSKGRADSRNNAALLDSLGLSSKPSIRPREIKVEKGNTETRLKKEGSVKRRKVVVEPTRRSGRVRAMEIDEEEGKKRKYVYVQPQFIYRVLILMIVRMNQYKRGDQYYPSRKQSSFLDLNMKKKKKPPQHPLRRGILMGD